jgi:hypothetical protein
MRTTRSIIVVKHCQFVLNGADAESALARQRMKANFRMRVPAVMWIGFTPAI